MDYLERLELTQTAFAEQSGIPLSVVNRACIGLTELSLKNAVRIQEATSGRVLPEDLVVENVDSGGSQGP